MLDQCDKKVTEVGQTMDLAAWTSRNTSIIQFRLAINTVLNKTTNARS